MASENGALSRAAGRLRRGADQQPVRLVSLVLRARGSRAGGDRTTLSQGSGLPGTADRPGDRQRCPRRSSSRGSGRSWASRGPGLIDRLFAGSAPEPSMLEAVRRARRAGIRTGLISNSWGTRRYDRAGLAELFDGVVISGDVGIRKPAREIYELGAEAIDLAPPACVFVDDLPFNLVPATELGHGDGSPRRRGSDDRRARAAAAGAAAVRRRLAAGAVVVLGTLFAGCGSSPLSTSELHNDATRICLLANRQTDQIATPTSPAGTRAVPAPGDRRADPGARGAAFAASVQRCRRRVHRGGQIAGSAARLPEGRACTISAR